MKEYVIEIRGRDYGTSLLSNKEEVLIFKSREAAREFANTELENKDEISSWTILSVQYAYMEGYK